MTLTQPGERQANIGRRDRRGERRKVSGPKDAFGSIREFGSDVPGIDPEHLDGDDRGVAVDERHRKTDTPRSRAVLGPVGEIRSGQDLGRFHASHGTGMA